MNNFTSIAHLLKEEYPTSALGTERQEYLPPQKPLEGAPLHEVVAHEVEQHMGEFVKDHKDIVELGKDLKELGVESTGTSEFTTTKPVTLPLNDDTIAVGLKAPFSTSLRWLSEFCVLLLKRAHTHLKLIHGKIVRVEDKTAIPKPA